MSNTLHGSGRQRGGRTASVKEERRDTKTRTVADQHTLSATVQLAYFSKSRVTICRWPLEAARWSAVDPS
jgi:hypothetical protein